MINLPISNQSQAILTHIKRAGSITRREAWIDYGVQCLTARICELRDAGYNIVTVRKRHPLTKQRYAEYLIG